MEQPGCTTLSSVLQRFLEKQRFLEQPGCSSLDFSDSLRELVDAISPHLTLAKSRRNHCSVNGLSRFERSQVCWCRKKLELFGGVGEVFTG